MKRQKKWPIVIAIVLSILVIIYLGVSAFFMNRFLPGTEINGLKSAGKTIAQVEEQLAIAVDEYSLQFVKNDGTSEEKTSEEFGLVYEGSEGLEEVKDSQNPFAWIVSLFNGQSVEVDLKITYNMNTFLNTVNSLECMQPENQVEPVSATVLYGKGSYSVVSEKVGNYLDSVKLYEVVKQCVAEMEPSVDLEKEGCYVKPVYTSESKEILKLQEEMNKYISTSITYTCGTLEVVLDHETIHEWLEIDEELNITISEDKMKEYVNFLSETFDTEDGDQIITTPNGREVTVENARRGRKVDVEAEYLQLVDDLKANVVTSRGPILSQEGTPEGEFGWGTSYIEVDMKEQHLWYIKNGEIIFESDIVTGKPSTPTPTGMYRVIEKKRDKVLRGDIQPDGSYGYESPVSYWMRLTWSGIGLHDATWQSAFGGQRYVNGYGSHGCINMPLSKAKELYNMISIGDRVVIHK